MRQLFLKWSIYCCSLFWAATGFAQGQLLSTTYFGEGEGLNITSLLDIFHDSKGFLWLAAREGLVRFDGHTFKYFRNEPGNEESIYKNFVHCIAEDADGNIWAGLARGGVSRYDRKTGKFRNYPFTEKLKIKTTSVIRIFFDRDNEVWIGVVGYGIVHLNPETGEFKAYDLVTAQTAPHLTPLELPSYNMAQNFWQDENGLLWCATTDDLYTFDPKTGLATPHRFEGKAANGFRQNQAYDMLPEGDWLWVGGWGSGLRRFNRKTGEWKQFLLEDNPAIPDAANVVNKIVPKSKDEFWISTEDKGLGIFNKKTAQFTFLANEPAQYPGFPKGPMGNACVDKQGNIWLRHSGKLLRIQFKERRFHFTPAKSVRPLSEVESYISAMLDDNTGRFRLIGLYGGDGLLVIDKKTGKTTVSDFMNQPGLQENNRMVRDIMQAHDGTIWVLGRHILYRFNPQTLRLEVPPQPPVFNPAVRTNYYVLMTEDGLGNIWMGTAMFGVFRYDPRTGHTTHFMPDENKEGDIPTNIVGVVRADGKGRAWFASRDRTCYGYFLADENRFVYLDANGNPTTELASLRMNNYFTDKKGDMWACTEQGLLHFDCSGDRPRLVKKYTMADGLPTDYVASGVEDNNGKLWVEAANNLCSIDKTTGQVSIFGKKDGVPANYSGIGSLGDGKLFLKAPYGYYTFSPDSLHPVRNKVPLILTSFRVNDKEQYQGSELLPSQRLVVPTDGRFFSLEFAALDLSSPELNRYEYQLQGFEKQWVKAGDRPFVNYTNIDAGHYSFRVKLEGTPDDEALSVPIIVRESFYKMGWFWVLVGSSALLAGGWFYLKRQAEERQLNELTKKTQLLEKEKAVVQYESLRQQLNPHFLFNSLTSLSSLITIDPKAAAGFLDSLSKTYRYILKSSERETVPLSEEIKFGESFVKLQKTRFGEGLQVHFKVEEEHFHRKIVPVTLQNLLENAIKHNVIDEEEPLVVEVFVEDDFLVVRNNLQKKKVVETSNKRGLTHLQSFYQYLSDRRIEVVEEGSFFTIKIPLI